MKQCIKTKNQQNEKNCKTFLFLLNNSSLSELSGSEKTDERFEKAKRGRFDVFVFREANINWILACVSTTQLLETTQGAFV